MRTLVTESGNSFVQKQQAEKQTLEKLRAKILVNPIIRFSCTATMSSMRVLKWSFMQQEREYAMQWEEQRTVFVM